MSKSTSMMLLALLFGMSTRTLGGAQAGRSRSQDGSNCVCTEQYDPVCGVNPATGQLEDFGNRCQADCENATSIISGACPASADCFCTLQYDPVCGTNPATGLQEDFGNRCQAGCKNASNVVSGICPTTSAPTEATCICTRIYKPVCGKDGNDYGNVCEANCKGADIAYNGKCNRKCICTLEYAPVCGVNNRGSWDTYSNACIAKCNRARVIRQGKCPAPRYCKLPAVTGPCLALFSRWYFDAVTGKCKEFPYGGCQGNKNNFKSREACEAKCNP